MSQPDQPGTSADPRAGSTQNRPPRRALTRAVAVGALVAAGLAPVALQAPAHAAPAGAAPRPATSSRHVVTLVTGDRVTVTGSGDAQQVSVAPAFGRKGIPLSIYRRSGHLFVVPSDALAMLGRHTLDSRLFDLTLQISLGYDDAHRTTVPLIVGYTGVRTAAAARPLGTPLRASGGRITHDLSSLRRAAVEVRRDRGALSWNALVTAPGRASARPADGLERIWLDGVRQPALDHSVPQIGAPTAWSAGYDGTGVTVAVLDTGIDDTHPDLAGKVLDRQNFTASADAHDVIGHGTHVASIISGTGAASSGLYTGVAPKATLFDGKVCEDFGCSESAILAGMQWASNVKHARVVNLSLGGPDVPGVDPLEDAVNSLSAANGTLFVIAAGNDGPGDSTLGSPGAADAALTVGAVDSTDDIAYFSSRGPRVGDGAVKPDVTAPGVDIVAAKSSTGIIGDPVGDQYVRLSGTSMATPHVAGVAAILAQQHPAWSGAQIKADLMASAVPNPTLTSAQQGAGRVDVARAITQSVTSAPSSLSLGTVAWPHTDDPLTTRTVTYTNSSATDLTLDLSLTVSGPRGSAAPAGMFSLDRSAVTVPAGGSATATLAVDTRTGGTDGFWSAELLATDGITQVSTPVGITQEIESYSLTLRHLTTTGDPAEFYGTLAVNLDTHDAYSLYDPSGVVTAHLPSGRYDLNSSVSTPGTWTTALLAYPDLDLTKDTAVDVDARLARPVSMRVPGPTATLRTLEVGYSHKDGIASTLFVEEPDSILSGPLGPSLAPDEFVSHVHAEYLRPSRTGSETSGATYFGLSASQRGSLFTGYDRTWRTSELARIDEDYLSTTPGTAAQAMVWPAFLGDDFMVADEFDLDLPSRRTEYLSTDAGTTWIRRLWVASTTQFLADLSTPRQEFLARQRVTDRWNGGPFSLSLADLGGGYIPWVGRYGDDIGLGLLMYGDGAGHAGGSPDDGGTTSLYSSDGTLLGSSDIAGSAFIHVPTATGRYRLVVEASRSGYTDLTTRYRYQWSFVSGTVAGDAGQAVPLFVVRPMSVSGSDGATVRSEARIPLTVQYQPGTPVRRIRKLTASVSYDDGATWRRAEASCDRHGCSVTTPHGSGSGGYLSLRINATDGAGTSVEETLIHAYRVRRS